MTTQRLAPLTGVAFIALVIIGFAIAGEPPDAESPAQEIVDHYVDNKTATEVGVLLAVPGLAFLIFFANHLRRVFDAAGDAALSTTILVGASIVGVGAAIDSTIQIALAESADDIEPTSVQTLQALWDNDFVPIALGLLVFLVSVGLSILRTGVLPRWLGWVALVLVVVGLTPIGFVAFLGTAILILVISIVLAVRAGRTGAPAPGTPATGA